MVITFLPRSKHLLISWLHSPFAVILEPKKIKSVTVSTDSPSICHEVMGPDARILVFWMLSFKPTFAWVLSLFRFHQAFPAGLEKQQHFSQDLKPELYMAAVPGTDLPLAVAYTTPIWKFTNNLHWLVHSFIHLWNIYYVPITIFNARNQRWGTTVDAVHRLASNTEKQM